MNENASETEVGKLQEGLKNVWGWNVFIYFFLLVSLSAVIYGCNARRGPWSDEDSTTTASASTATSVPPPTSTTAAEEPTTTTLSPSSSTVVVSIAGSPSPQTTLRTVVATTIAQRAKTTTTPPTTASPTSTAPPQTAAAVTTTAPSTTITPTTTIATTTTIPPTTTTTIAGRIVTFDFGGTWSAAEKSATIDINKNNNFSLEAVNTSAWTAVLPDGTTTFTFRMYRYLNAWYTANPGSGDSNHPTNYAASSTNATCTDGGSLNSIGQGQMAGYYRLVTCTATGSGAIVLPITYVP